MVGDLPFLVVDFHLFIYFHDHEWSFSVFHSHSVCSCGLWLYLPSVSWPSLSCPIASSILPMPLYSYAHAHLVVLGTIVLMQHWLLLECASQNSSTCLLASALSLWSSRMVSMSCWTDVFSFFVSTIAFGLGFLIMLHTVDLAWRNVVARTTFTCPTVGANLFRLTIVSGN